MNKKYELVLEEEQLPKIRVFLERADDGRIFLSSQKGSTVMTEVIIRPNGTMSIIGNGHFREGSEKE